MDEVGYSNLRTEIPFLMQRVSSLNIFAWGVVLCSHAACKDFAGLVAVRLVLGICEGCITSGFLIVSSMFYTRREQTTRIGYCCKTVITAFYYSFSPFNSSNGRNWFVLKSLYRQTPIDFALAGQIMTSFISFGSLHIHTTRFEPWQWYDQVQRVTSVFTFL